MKASGRHWRIKINTRSLDSKKEIKRSVCRNGKKMPGQIRQHEDTNSPRTKDRVITGNTATMRTHLPYYSRQSCLLPALSFLFPIS